jgi:hypothetical protein
MRSTSRDENVPDIVGDAITEQPVGDSGLAVGDRGQIIQQSAFDNQRLQ